VSDFGRLSTALADRYRIERELGAGGMATVYLAADLKHDRKVAIKVLKPELAAVLGAERFVQEIKTTAALSHPHILPLFDSGEAGGFLYYVMPWIDGETIREKLNRETQFGIDDAVKIATEVADALDYAHGRGVIHRDIKPENILLHNGRPMVMDFGIALAVSAAAGGRMTETGLSLGTPHYMSPEQATADRQITARSDIYSLASVLYEMLTGEPPHMGTSAQQIIMKIIAEPVKPAMELRKSVPPHVSAALGKALEKLPADRFDSARAFAETLQNPAYADAMARASHAAAAAPDWRRRVAIPALVVAALALGVAGWSLTRPVPPPLVARYAVDLSRFNWSSDWCTLAISPDGSRLVYAISDERGARLASRPIDQLDAADIPGTEGGINPFFSPDGRRVGFMLGGRAVKVVGFDGAPAITVADSAVGSPGAAWGPDGFIYFDKLGAGGLLRVPDRGGAKPEEVSQLDTVAGEQQHVWPDALPNGKGLLFTVNHTGPGQQGGPTDEIAVLDLQTRKHRVLFRGVRARYAASGHLLYSTWDGILMAVPFDQERLELTGDPVAMAEGVRVLEAGGAVDLVLSQNGTLLYRSGAGLAMRRDVVWASRDGIITPIDTTWLDGITGPALSPDGRHLAVSLRRLDSRSIWVKELRPGGALSRITFEGANTDPWWTEDGRTIRYTDVQGSILEVPSDGSAMPRSIFSPDRLTDGVTRVATSTRDGQWLVLQSTSANLFGVRLASDSAPIPLATGPAIETTGRVSPDGRWLLYLSSRSGLPNVFVASFPNTSRSLAQVTQEGAVDARWSRDGKEILYTSFSNEMVSVAVQSGAALSLGERKVLFPVGRATEWDVAADGRILLVRAREAVGGSQEIIVEHFFEELKARVPR